MHDLALAAADSFAQTMAVDDRGSAETISAGDVAIGRGSPLPQASLPGYDLGAVIGSGGMGEVVVGLDHKFRREVAVKRIRSDEPAPQLVTRFLREAQIQARLQHPAIVPVHELGEDSRGRPYFTMQKLTGTTLATMLERAERPPRQRLLRAFAELCLAIEYAHSRGVVHRDLKPANIMLGNYGEVYVLDWGVARVIGEAADPIEGDITTLEGMTQLGSILGTPGYMAPEQLHGEPDVGPPADVYALGAILFELLAGEPLHPPGKAAFTSTLAGVQHGPSERRRDHDAPPELDALCLAALADRPEARPSTREVAERVQRYLDGDRDLERRRALAADQLAIARAGLACEAAERRSEAMLAAGRALALDPESRDAAELVTKLMLEAPKVHPPELAAELAAGESEVQHHQGRTATRAFAAIVVFLVAAAATGLRDAPLLIGMVAFTVVLAAISRVVSRRSARPFEMLALAAANACLAALLSRVFSPLLLVPAVTCVMAVSLTSYPQLIGRKWIVLGMMAASWLVPVVLEWLGILAGTWSVRDGVVTASSSVVQVGGTATIALLVGTNVLIIVVIGLFANALAAARRDAQRQVTIQAWQLRQLLPRNRPSRVRSQS